MTLSLPVSAEIVHAGGVVCGQAIMAAADTAMLVAMIAQLGEFRPMTTVQLQTSFVRPVPKDAAQVAVVARVLRHGQEPVLRGRRVQDRGREAGGARDDDVRACFDSAGPASARVPNSAGRQLDLPLSRATDARLNWRLPFRAQPRRNK